MKRITKEELPDELNEETINTLVEMALEDPKQSFDWANVSALLEERGQLNIILEKVRKIKKAKEQAKEDAKTEEQKRLEAEHNRKADEEVKKFFEENGYYPFQGNMGEPVTLEDYKLRYGSYPPGYDENGNKIK